MAEPSKKFPEMEQSLERMFGRTTAITSNTCSWCKGPADSFKDELSRSEYRISGFCQKCQDETFDEEVD